MRIVAFIPLKAVMNEVLLTLLTAFRAWSVPTGTAVYAPRRKRALGIVFREKHGFPASRLKTTAKQKSVHYWSGLPTIKENKKQKKRPFFYRKKKKQVKMTSCTTQL